MNFAASDALFPAGELAQTIAAGYDAQCKLLCFGRFPSWAEVQARFAELKPLL